MSKEESEMDVDPIASPIDTITLGPPPPGENHNDPVGPVIRRGIIDQDDEGMIDDVPVDSHFRDISSPDPKPSGHAGGLGEQWAAPAEHDIVAGRAWGQATGKNNDHYDSRDEDATSRPVSPSHSPDPTRSTSTTRLDRRSFERDTTSPVSSDLLGPDRGGVLHRSRDARTITPNSSKLGPEIHHFAHPLSPSLASQRHLVELTSPDPGPQTFIVRSRASLSSNTDIGQDLDVNKDNSDNKRNLHQYSIAYTTTAKDSVDGIDDSLLSPPLPASRRRSLPHRPVPIKPSRSSISGERPSPYNIPLPLSAASHSRLSAGYPYPMAAALTSTPSTSSQVHMQDLPRRSSNTSPTGRRHASSSSATGQPGYNSRIASPSGTLSQSPGSKRRAPPAFPTSPRETTVTSHRALIALSAGLPPPGQSQTPTALRVPPTAQWSPAFHRSGYSSITNHPRPLKASPNPYHIPHSPTYPQPPHSAAPSYHRRPGASSAPQISSPKLPDQLAPPIPGEGIATEQGTYKLKNVSVAWVVQKLNSQAPNFWFNPASADCRIVIPWTDDRRLNRRASDQPIAQTPQSAASVHSNQPGMSYWPPTPIAPIQPPKHFASGIGQGQEDVVSAFQIQSQKGRRGSLPEHDQVPVMLFSLHQDYLITQSKLFRLLLSSAPPHLDMPLPVRTALLEGEDPTLPVSESALKGARIVPTAQGEPTTIIVPLPDPESFGLIVHWLYWGDGSVIEDALSSGQVSWQGLVRSIDYLDLDVPIKRIVGKWWRKWIKTESQAIRPGSGPSEAWFDEQDDEDEGDEIGRGKSIRGRDGDSDGEEDDMGGGSHGAHRGEGQQPEMPSELADGIGDDMLGALEKL